MASDVFPTTQNTWIDWRLAEGEEGRLDVNHHVMSVYAHPLEVYFRGTSWRFLGEPEDIIQGFFADRLDRKDFFMDWRRSGKPLRRWLANAFSFYLMELRRGWRKEIRSVPLSEEAVADQGGDPGDAYDRAFAVSLVQQALERGRSACEGQGLSAHWRVFLSHYYEGKGYSEMAGEFGVDPARAAVMARTAAKKFRSALRMLLSQEGITEEGMDGEIHSLLEVTRA